MLILSSLLLWSTIQVLIPGSQTHPQLSQSQGDGSDISKPVILRQMMDLLQKLIDLDEPSDKPEVSCPGGFEEHEGSCYYFSINANAKGTWQQARTKCQNLGKNVDLVEFGDPHTSVSDVWVMEKIILSGQKHWLGASDPNHNNGWTWAHSGRSVSLNHPFWHETDPHLGSEYCLFTWPMGNRTPRRQYMADDSCDHVWNYICQVFN